MARKSTARAAKTASVGAAVRPRNPLTVAARKRSAGPHGPTLKAQRAAAKVRLKKGLDGG
jgi:hypothetical protein